MTVHLYCGHHSEELLQILSQSWKNKELVILVPPSLQSFTFLELFSKDEVQFHGDFTESSSFKFREDSHHQVPADEVLHQARLGVLTSGTSSGNPRLVLYSETNIESSLGSIRQLFDEKRIQKIFSYPQPTHAFGLVLGYMQAILSGLEIVFSPGIYSKKSHEHWLKLVDENTLTLGAPAHFMDLIQKVKNENLQPNKSYSAIVGGAPVTISLWKQMQSVLNIEAPSVGYGASEASPGVTHLPPGIAPSEDGDIGFVLEGVAMEAGAVGVRFSGPNLCLAIYENGRLLQFDQILLSDQLSVKATPHGQRYTFLGRTDLLVNRGGVKHSLEVIEGRLSAVFQCKCVAVSFFDQRLGEDIGILYQSQDDVARKIQNLLMEEFGMKLPLSHIHSAEIPHSPNGKIDRQSCLKCLLRTRPFSFPVSVRHLMPFLPHRGSAIWVDEILETRTGWGRGRVKLNPTANYFSPEGLRQTAFIEWIAQCYGYVTILNDLTGIQFAAQAPKTFIAEIKQAQFFHSHVDFSHLKEMSIEVHCTHDFGLLKVIQGKIFDAEDVLLAQVDMKVYCGH